MKERIEKLRQGVLDAKPSIDIHRARLLTEVFEQSRGNDRETIWGEAMHHLFSKLPIAIHDGELIVGSATTRPRAAQLFPEVQASWLDPELDILNSREYDPFDIEDPNKAELRDSILPFWKGNTIYDWVVRNCPEETKNILFFDPTAFPTKSSAVIDNFSLIQKGVGTVVPNYERILRLGIKGILKEIEIALDRLDLTDPEDAKKRCFLKSTQSTLEGFRIFANRYAALANRMAKAEKDKTRKGELEKIAEICSWVPENPPKNFWEAIQSFWFTHVAVRIEASGHSLSPGRFDQYVYPFYAQDDRPEKKDFALEIIKCLFIKFSESAIFSSADTSKFYTGLPQWQNLNLGGRNKEGRDATNDISYLCLEAMIDLRLVQPDISVRIHQEGPESFLNKACELTKLGTGHPKFYNEDLIAHSMASKGLSLESSRNFSIMGCVEPRVTGKEGIHLTGGFINLPEAVELALTDGVWRLTGRKIGPSTGDPGTFESFEAFYEAFKKQLSHMLRQMFVVNAIAQHAYSELLSTPFLSALTEGCIEKGKSLQKGGALYNFGPSVNGIGIADTIDSLYAVKKMVFEEEKLKMPEVISALESNFKGQEHVRNILKLDVPKFGNDEDEVDRLAHDVIQYFNEECMSYKNMYGGNAQAGIIPVTAGIAFGKITGALPSGRKAGEPFADGSSPSHGNDRKGPTAVVKSVAKLDLARMRNGDLLNMRLSPTSVKTPEGLRKLGEFIRGFCDVGGWHIQFNVVDSSLLREAQEHPEQYTDLLVRVAGYSAYFTQLHKEIQDDIINRTEYCI